MNLTIMSNDEYQQMEEDEEDPIDDDQLNDYREMVDDLGTFPVSSFGCARTSAAIYCSDFLF
jgi:hypothetical protein